MTRRPRRPARRPSRGGRGCGAASAGPGRRRGRRGRGTRPGPALGTGEPCPEHGDEQEVEQPVEHDLLAGLVLADLVGQQADERRVPLLAAARRSGGRAPSRRWLISVRLVGAGEHRRGAVARCCPTCARRGPSPRSSSSPPGVVQCCPGWMTICGVVSGGRRTCRARGRGRWRRRRCPRGRAPRRRGRSRPRPARRRPASAGPRPGSGSTTADPSPTAAGRRPAPEVRRAGRPAHPWPRTEIVDDGTWNRADRAMDRLTISTSLRP